MMASTTKAEKPPMRPAERLQWYADRINGDAAVSTAMISADMVKALLHANLVTPQDLRKKGIPA